MVATARTSAPARLAGLPDERRGRLDVRVADMRDLPSLPGLVAALALAMLSNAYLTGQVVLLDGGIRPD